MPFATFVKRTSFVVAAFGFTAYALATMPAAALPLSGFHPNKPIGPIGEIGNRPIEGGHGPVVNPNPNHPPFHICPFSSPECNGPPRANPNPNPNPPTGGHGPVVINPPPVIIAPPPVVVAAPLPGFAGPQPAYAPRPMPMPAQAPSAAANPSAAAAPSCNCLTKQYQQDGSVVFRDLCTHEAAMATQADLQAAQNPSQNSSQDQPQPAPAK